MGGSQEGFLERRAWGLGLQRLHCSEITNDHGPGCWGWRHWLLQGWRLGVGCWGGASRK